MPILSISTDQPMQVGNFPRIIRIYTTDSFSAVTTAGYLNNTETQGFSYYPSDIIAMTYNTINSAFFTLSISGGIITLVPNSTNVILPVNENHIACFADTEGTFTDDVATAINGGNIQAGLSGTAGTVASFPSTASKGSLKLAAVANTGNTNTTISNAAMGQASTISIPDPAKATANFAITPNALVNGNLVIASGTQGLLADAGARIISGTTAAWGGGGGSNVFTVPGLGAGSVGSPVIRSSGNQAYISSAIPNTNTLTVTFNTDPGAGTQLDYIYTTFSLS